MVKFTKQNSSSSKENRMKKNIIAIVFAVSFAFLSCILLGCTEELPADEIMNETIEFGHYNQRPIQWYVLDKDTTNHRTFLVAKDVLDEKPYNYISSETVMTWDMSTIRSWLNGYDASQNKMGIDYSSDNFISSAFTSDEQARIATIQVINNPQNGEPNTVDKVFFLSIDEVKTFLGSSKGVCAKLNCTIEWWLRTQGNNDAHDAAFVKSNGRLDSDGTWVNSDMGIRPALWLND